MKLSETAKAVLEELKAAGLKPVVETSGKTHLKITAEGLPSPIYASGTPSCPFAARKARAVAKRRLRQAQTPGHAWLRREFPAVFDRLTPPPLMIGVTQLIMARRPAHISVASVALALGERLGSREYVGQIAVGGPRFNLDDCTAPPACSGRRSSRICPTMSCGS